MSESPPSGDSESNSESNRVAEDDVEIGRSRFAPQKQAARDRSKCKRDQKEDPLKQVSGSEANLWTSLRKISDGWMTGFWTHEGTSHLRQPTLQDGSEVGTGRPRHSKSFFFLFF